jgi:hypothetical protein
MKLKTFRVTRRGKVHGTTWVKVSASWVPALCGQWSTAGWQHQEAGAVTCKRCLAAIDREAP